MNRSAQATRGKARIKTKKMRETGAIIYTDIKTWLLGWSSVYCDWTEGEIGGEDGRKGKSRRSADNKESVRLGQQPRDCSK